MVAPLARLLLEQAPRAAHPHALALAEHVQDGALVGEALLGEDRLDDRAAAVWCAFGLLELWPKVSSSSC